MRISDFTGMYNESPFSVTTDSVACIRIKSGMIILQKEVGGKQTVIARMGADATFGEMSVLDKQIISATVIADSDKVELYVMEVNGVYDLFKSRYVARPFTN